MTQNLEFNKVFKKSFRSVSRASMLTSLSMWKTEDKNPETATNIRVLNKRPGLWPSGKKKKKKSLIYIVVELVINAPTVT